MMQYTLEKLMSRAGMTQVQALNFMNRIRNDVYALGGKVTRVIRDGLVRELIVSESWSS